MAVAEEQLSDAEAAAAIAEQDPTGVQESQAASQSTFDGAVSSATETVKQAATNAYNALSGQERGSEPANTENKSSWMSAPAATPSPTVYVGNLFFDVREDDLRREFESCGTIESAKVVMDSRGLSKG